MCLNGSELIFHMSDVLVLADKAADNFVVVDDCTILIFLSVSLLTLMCIKCSLLGVRG